MQTGFNWMKIRNRELKHWIYRGFQAFDNIQQSTTNISLGSFYEENNLLTDRVSRNSFKTCLSFGFYGV